MTTTQRQSFWVGTYPRADAPSGSGEGIWFVGPAAAPVQVARCPSPSFIAAHPARPRLYAVGEGDPGAVSAFLVRSSSLEPRGSIPSGGSGPCHLAVHPNGRWLYVANYGDGVVGAVALDPEGDLTDDVVLLPHAGGGPDPDRQEGPHAHSCTVSPGGGHLLVADLGTDEIRAYPLDGHGRPAADPVLSALPPGTGPRHVAVRDDVLLVTLELSDEVAVLAWDETTGSVRLLARTPTTAVRSGPARNYPSHLVLTVREDGTALLDVAVRGADVVSTFAVRRDAGTADLELLGECPTATWPRHLERVGGTVVVAGERAHTLAVHARDATGVLRPADRWIDVPAPACVLPVP